MEKGYKAVTIDTKQFSPSLKRGVSLNTLLRRGLVQLCWWKVGKGRAVPMYVKMFLNFC